MMSAGVRAAAGAVLVSAATRMTGVTATATPARLASDAAEGVGAVSLGGLAHGAAGSPGHRVGKGDGEDVAQAEGCAEAGQGDRGGRYCLRSGS